MVTFDTVIVFLIVVSLMRVYREIIRQCVKFMWTYSRKDLNVPQALEQFLKAGICLLLFIPLKPVNCYDMLSTLDDSQQNANFREILAKIYQERTYESIILFKAPGTECAFEDTILRMSVPILVPQLYKPLIISNHFNNEVLNIVCFDGQFDEEVSQMLVDDLEAMRQRRILILGRNFEKPERLLPHVLVMVEATRMTNVIVLFETREPENVFYRLKPFPEYHFTREEYDVGETDFFSLEWDLKGRTILTLPDQNAPRSFLYKNPDGSVEISGYVGKLVKHFAEFSNASLKFPYPVEIGQQISLWEIIAMARNNTVDMSIAETSMNTPYDLRSLTYPIEIGFWMFTVPCSREVPISDVYLIVVDSNIWLILAAFQVAFSALHSTIERLYMKVMGKFLPTSYWKFILNDKSLPGLLGQPFALRTFPATSIKIMYFFLFLLGLAVNTMYGAYFNTLMTQPPNKPQLESYDDLLTENAKISLTKGEVNYIKPLVGEATYERVERQILTVSDADYYKGRNNFNTSTGYSVTNSHWDMYDSIQQHFHRKMFCKSEAFIFQPLLPLSIPLQKNTLYKDNFDLFIHRVHGAGLLYIWKLQTYNEMLKEGKIPRNDNSQTYQIDQLHVEDLQWVWVKLAAAWIMCLAVFCTELVFNRFKLKC